MKSVYIKKIKWTWKKYLKSVNYFKNILESEIGTVVAAFVCNNLCSKSLIKKRELLLYFKYYLI